MPPPFPSSVSIPQGTIKRCRRQTSKSSCRVSIPQGTIKSPTEKNGIVEMALFQFHKVRLKDEVEKQSYSTNLVSIPQGTIKRRQRSSRKPVNATFQFHKVRLKVIFFLHFCNSDLFQFHKVRLKV